jgi:transcriptional regulator with XRE-family HTH domain
METLSGSGDYRAVKTLQNPPLQFDRAAVGRRLDATREALGLEKGSFAESVGIDPSSYSKIIAGKKALNADMAYAISERYGIPMEYLYRGRLTDLPESLAAKLRSA